MKKPTLLQFISFVIIISALSIHLFFDGITRLYHPTPGFHQSEIPDQTGKVIIITGGTTGVGRASAELLYLRGAKLIIITSRSKASAEKAAQEIQHQYKTNENGIRVIGMELALEDHASIKRFAEWFRSLNEPLHVLMLNAGLVSADLAATSVGLEKTLGINWFGHFYLQQLLQDIVERSAPSRVVIVSSAASWMTQRVTKPIEEYSMLKYIHKPGFNQYSMSKMFNILHGTELHRRMRAKGVKDVYSIVIHPGGVRTNVFPSMLGQKDYSFSFWDACKYAFERNIDIGVLSVVITMLADLFALDPSDGALTQLYAATSPDVEKLDISGEFLFPIARREDHSIWNLGLLSGLGSQSKNETLAKELWEFGETLIARIEKAQ